MATASTNLSDFANQELGSAEHLKFGIVVAEWNSDITENLYLGAHDLLLSLGCPIESIDRINVPGTFELVYGAKLMCELDQYDAIITIGCVIQGETKHFDFVCQGVTQGIQDLNLKYTSPVIFCVLTDNTKQQSIDRSGGIHGNKGIECAVAAVKMAKLHKELNS